MLAPHRSARPHYAWVILAVTGLTVVLTAGVTAVPAVLIHPLEVAFGWDRAAIALAVSINVFLYGLAGPFAGRVMLRVGPRRVMLTSLLLIAIGVAAATQIQTVLHLYLLWGVVVGIGTGSTALVLSATVVNRWFTSQRGLALGLLGAASSTGGIRDRVWIEEAKGGVVEERAAPRASFAGHVLTTPWDTLQALSFVSYALWNYLDTPFVCTEPGFETRESGPHEEHGETWHRLLVKYPPSIPTHYAEQVLYFNGHGLLQRLDYSVDVVGDMVAGAASHYCFDHTPFGSLVIPTLRRAVSRTPKGAVFSGPTGVWLQMSDITLIPNAPKEKSNDRERTTVRCEEVLGNQGPENGLYRRGRRRSHRVRAWKPDLILSVAQRHASLSWPGPADCLRHDRNG
jgi:hypothetical protein